MENWTPLGSIAEFEPTPPPPPPSPQFQPRPERPVAAAPARVEAKPRSKTSTSGVGAGAGAGIGGLILLVVASVVGQAAGRGAVDFACRAPLGAPKDFDSAEGGFRVKIPDSHEISTQVQPVAGTRATMTMHMGTNDRSPMAFGIGWMDVPAGVDFDFDGGMRGAVENLNGTVRTQKVISYRGSPGREFTYTGNHSGSDVSGIARIYLVRRRTYMLMFVKKGHAEENPPAAAAFLDSFSTRR